LRRRPENYLRPASAFGRNNGGAIPPNLLQIPNTDSNSHYLRTCKALGYESHPARFPADLPRFFIKFLTDPGQLVVDIFSGSNVTGAVAEELGRRWLSVDVDAGYAALSVVRFLEGHDLPHVQQVLSGIDGRSVPCVRSTIPPVQAELFG
jgi:DNA modification methylase